MQYLTKKQQEVRWKKRLVVELRNNGLTFEQVNKELNEQLKKKNLKLVTNDYARITYNRMERNGEL